MRPIVRGLAVLGTALILAACGGGSSTSAPTSAGGGGATAGAGATAGTGSAPCADSTGTTTVQASVENFEWMPATVAAKVGDVITWTNGDSVPHQVGLDDNSCKQSKAMAGGASGSLTFTQAGTFPFHCTIHPNMKGTFNISA